jgi:hypothetical protein
MPTVVLTFPSPQPGVPWELARLAGAPLLAV